jgi:phage terminase large subunit-like protein
VVAGVSRLVGRVSTIDLAGLDVRAQDDLIAACTPPLTRYIPQVPHPKQAAFLLLDQREAFYGGAAGPGKSSGLLMGALQHVDQPNYAALIVRRSFKQLSLPGALMSRSHEWLAGTDARWSAGTSTIGERLVPAKSWIFPSGATLTFAHLGRDHESRRQFESAEFQYIGVDELTAFDETEYTFLFSRLRRLAGSSIPTRMRSASNPGGRGHSWVKRRFVEASTREPGAVFIRATLADNPSLDEADYVENLQKLHPTTWKRLLHGDWDASDAGELFQPRAWYGERPELLVDDPPGGFVQAVRYWDTAAAEPTAENPDPDFTVGLKMSRQSDGMWTVEHIARWRLTAGRSEQRMGSIAREDDPRVVQWVEQTPGVGKAYADHLRHGDVFPVGVRVKADPVTGVSKAVRWVPLAAAMEKGRVRIVKGTYLGQFFDELEACSEDVNTSGPHDDQADAGAGAFGKLQKPAGTTSGGQLPERGTISR